jgi:hypothetical protein
MLIPGLERNAWEKRNLDRGHGDARCEMRTSGREQPPAAVDLGGAVEIVSSFVDTWSGPPHNHPQPCP